MLPTFRFPAGVFLPENENRVKWLRPTDELLVFPMVRAEVRVGPKREARAVPFRDMCRLAAIANLRQGEICTLRREYVDLA